MIGNSSSGIIEAPILSLPVINIGFRQNNRLRGNNVFDVEGDTKKIKELIKKLFTDINMIKNLKEHPYSPYGDGNAAKRIMNIILSLTNVEKLKSNNFQNNSLLIEILSQIEQINYSDFPDRGITPQELLKLYLPKEKKKI